MRAKSITNSISIKRGLNNYLSSSTRALGSLSKAKSPRRSVSFDLNQTVFHEVAHMDAEECSCRWYSEEEFQKFKDDNYFTYKMIRYMEANSRDPESYSRVLIQAYRACCQGSLSKTQQEALAKQVKLWMQRTGLEILVVKDTAKDKVKRRRAVVEIAKSLPPTKSRMSSDEIQELIRKQCEEVTLPAKLFAQALGKAHHS